MTIPSDGPPPVPATGTLTGVRVVEFAGLGPAPHCAMLLADHGAEIVRIARADDSLIGTNPVVERGRSTITLDLRHEADRDRALEILDTADVLVEGFRPGVMERLGLGPDVVARRNPGLVYARMTGWGQEGPLSRAAGHDLNYIAVVGGLAAIGEAGRPPPPPLNLVGDYGGGSLYLAFGIVAALVERNRSGLGQVIDAAIVDGTASMMALFSGLLPSAQWGDLGKDRNLLNGGAPNYRCYRCADGLDLAVGPLEPQFYRALIEGIGAPADLLDRAISRSDWPEDRASLAEIFASRPRAEWLALLDGQDACVTPVLTLEEAKDHPHLHARRTYVGIDGALHPAPAPRFSRSPGTIRLTGDDPAAVLARWRARGVDKDGNM